MAFHDVRLPEDVERGATGGPLFHTTIIDLANGSEQRNVDWSEARHEWELAYGVQNKEDYSVVRNFFFARRGMAHTFLFKDWSDYQLIDETQGVGDGLNSEFQLICTYENDGPSPYYRRITRPIEDTIVWKVDGVVRGATHNGLGVYTLSGAPPIDGAVVTASGEFDMCVRFNVDKFGLSLQVEDAGSIGSLPVIEVRE
jgi:uncharacterized protein (TIGR02217 family)